MPSNGGTFAFAFSSGLNFGLAGFGTTTFPPGGAGAPGFGFFPPAVGDAGPSFFIFSIHNCFAGGINFKQTAIAASCCIFLRLSTPLKILPSAFPIAPTNGARPALPIFGSSKSALIFFNFASCTICFNAACRPSTFCCFVCIFVTAADNSACFAKSKLTSHFKHILVLYFITP